MTIRALLLAWAITLAPAADQVAGSSDPWDPHAHPALVQQRITVPARPLRHLVLAAEDSARVRAIGLAEGATATGTEAIELDDRLPALALRQAQAALAEATQRQAQAAISVDQARSALAYARVELTRATELRSREAGAQAVLDAAQQQYDQAALALTAAEAALAQAKLARNAAALAEEHATLILQRHRIPLPAGWTLRRIFLHPGALASPGEPLLELSDCSALLLDLHCDAASLAALREGRITVFRDGKVVPGAVIHRVEVVADPQTRKRLVELRIPGSPDLAGALHDIVLQVADSNGLLRVPAGLLRRDLEQDLVRSTDGSTWPVRILRRQGGEALVPAADLPAGTLLIPHD